MKCVIENKLILAFFTYNTICMIYISWCYVFLLLHVYFLVLWDQWLLRIEYSLRRCLEAWEMLHFSLSLIARLNKTESAIFISLSWFGCSRGIDFFQNFYVHNSGCYVLCGGRTKSPRLRLSVVIYFPVLRDQWFQYI